MCPKAEQLLGKLATLGVGAERIVPIAFHVDYFNDPWKDPFSDPGHSQRELAYNRVMKRDDLYFTPMLMVDGRSPMLGSDEAKALTALKQVLKDRPGAALDLVLKKGDAGDPARKSLEVTVSALSAAVVGRELLVGVAIFEDPVKTHVSSGENAGKDLVDRFAVRKFRYQSARLAGKERKRLTFPVELGADWVPLHCGLAVFVQDWKTGRVYQAESIPWTTPSGPARDVPGPG